MTATKTAEAGTERPERPCTDLETAREMRKRPRSSSTSSHRRRAVGAAPPPGLDVEIELEAPDTVADVVDARDRLRAVLAVALTENERAALARVMRGEPIARHEKTLQSALWRLRRKLAA